jgi:hypothetical protein
MSAHGHLVQTTSSASTLQERSLHCFSSCPIGRLTSPLRHSLDAELSLPSHHQSLCILLPPLNICFVQRGLGKRFRSYRSFLKFS